MLDNPSVSELGELLDEVTDKVPRLINGLLDTLYSAEAGKKMGQSVGNLYKELVESGIPQAEALQLAKDYMLTFKNVMSTMQSQSGQHETGTQGVWAAQAENSGRSE